MNNVRWKSPFPYTLAFNLFKQHFEEINRSYWAFVPAANTVKALAKRNLIEDAADPKKFFMVPDEEDRRLAPTYGEWKVDFSEYMNYSRLNIVMLLSSCFETYLRTIVSLAFESKPAVIIQCNDAVDGAALLKRDIKYGDMNDKSYRFREMIDEICHGEWKNRFSYFQKYFGTLPQQLLDLSRELDELRVTRNNLGHYFGRNKNDYGAPISFEPLETVKVSHERIQKYFKLIYTAAKLIDNYLQDNIIGSYDIIKVYFNSLSSGEILSDLVKAEAYQLRKIIGHHDLTLVGKNYYDDLITYCEINYAENATDCIFTKSRCVREINRRLREDGIELTYGGRAVIFDPLSFKLLLIRDNLYNNEKYSRRNMDNQRHVQYLHSSALIDYVTNKIETNADSIIEILKGNPNKP